MRKGKGFDAIMASDAVFLTAAEVGEAAGWSPDLIRAQARSEPASLGFPVTVLGARTYIPRIPFLSFCGLLEEAKASEAERRRVEEQKRVLAIMEDM